VNFFLHSLVNAKHEDEQTATTIFPVFDMARPGIDMTRPVIFRVFGVTQAGIELQALVASAQPAVPRNRKSKY